MLLSSWSKTLTVRNTGEKLAVFGCNSTGQDETPAPGKPLCLLPCRGCSKCEESTETGAVVSVAPTMMRVCINDITNFVWTCSRCIECDLLLLGPSVGSFWRGNVAGWSHLLQELIGFRLYICIFLSRLVAVKRKRSLFYCVIHQ